MQVLVPMENPLWSSTFDVVWSALIFLVSALMLGALFDVMRNATFLKAVEWVVLIVLVPLVGPAIWFAYGRRRFVD